MKNKRLDHLTQVFLIALELSQSLFHFYSVLCCIGDCSGFRSGPVHLLSGVGFDVGLSGIFGNVVLCCCSSCAAFMSSVRCSDLEEGEAFFGPPGYFIGVVCEVFLGGDPSTELQVELLFELKLQAQVTLMNCFQGQVHIGL